MGDPEPKLEHADCCWQQQEGELVALPSWPAAEPWKDKKFRAINISLKNVPLVKLFGYKYIVSNWDGMKSSALLFSIGVEDHEFKWRLSSDDDNHLRLFSSNQLWIINIRQKNLWDTPRTS